MTYRDRHGRWARDAMDAADARDECARRGRQSRVVPAPPILKFLKNSPKLLQELQNRKRHWNQYLQLPFAFEVRESGAASGARTSKAGNWSPDADIKRATMLVALWPATETTKPGLRGEHEANR